MDQPHVESGDSGPASSAEPSRLRLAVWGLTDVGQVRSENQDTFLAIEFAREPSAEHRHVGPDREADDSAVEHLFRPGPAGALLLVADGMGGMAGGGTASALAVSTLARAIEESWPGADGATPREFSVHLDDVIREANDRVLARAAEEPELRGMGTTLTGVGILGNELVCAQVGDSRAYRFRDGKLARLTRDQTVVQEMLDAGEISAEEARTSDKRNLILQALGSAPRLDVVFSYEELSEGDALLLCSDGLSGVVEDESLADVLEQADNPREACEALVLRANEAGGPDNITVLVCEVREAG